MCNIVHATSVYKIFPWKLGGNFFFRLQYYWAWRWKLKLKGCWENLGKEAGCGENYIM